MTPEEQVKFYLSQAELVLKEAGFAYQGRDWNLIVEVAKMLQKEELKK